MKADHKKVMTSLKTAKGQLEGIIRMVDDDRYCIDISYQLLAVIALLKKTNNEVLHAHLTSCVKDSFGKEESDVDEKIGEILQILDKIQK
ncbi:MAG: metal-sensing transcriptional repressor [Sphaerochaetaceae bacterium]|nr:metal-sensing transcriptional repressor [Sphaerochaetaceae bacterium]